MMKDLRQVLQEIGQHLEIAVRLARFNIASRWADNYLGSLWNYLEPCMYIGTYFVIFGLGMYGGTINGQPYILWLLIGIVPWYFVKGSFSRGLTSIKSQLGMLTKTKFPMSIAPVVPMIEEFRRFIIMLVMSIGVMFLFGVVPTVSWLQLGYAIFAMWAFLLGLNLLTSTLTLLVPDFQTAANAVFRLAFFISGVIINFDARSMPETVVVILKMMPFYQIIDNFRASLLFNQSVFHNPLNTVFFWTLTLLMLWGGSIAHVRFRGKFMDLI
ncbi:ABC transporter permease [Weissella tructae]|uniref:Transport permease protein n=2 Tax=Weissella TaxID=46255 RepID=A0A075TVX9_9LACO|nr:MULTISPECIES: ABC transporter permease [Weissella]AIG65719.1 Transport permease protein [Weissella tructae]AIM63035.1 Transport permease protein [Weissella ceti]AIM64434.1 Transport permease protein [Weissella ceti]ELA06828.1 teichoic acid translocation permease protein [Weissella ceti NC36]QVV90885.1 ABC transporter permease [Weissella tructae]